MLIVNPDNVKWVSAGGVSQDTGIQREHFHVQKKIYVNVDAGMAKKKERNS